MVGTLFPIILCLVIIVRFSSEASTSSVHDNPTVISTCVSSTIDTMPGFVYRENRVPYYQRLFQEGGKKHVRQWQQTTRGNYMMRVYMTALWGGFGGAMYMMTRLLFGHKTWY